MPVSKISIFGESSTNVGGSRWIGQRSPVAASPAVDGVADHVPDAPERLVADGHRDRLARVDDLGSARETVGRVHRDRAHAIVAEMLLHLGDQLHRAAALDGHLDAERVIDLGQPAGKTASRTTPLISTILPMFCRSRWSAMCLLKRGEVRVCSSARERVRAGDDLEDLLRDLRLARAVHRERETVDQLAGVLRRVAHRRHLRRRGTTAADSSSAR